MANFKAAAGDVCTECGHTFTGGENVGINAATGKPRHYNERICNKLKKARLTAEAARVTKKLATDETFRERFNALKGAEVIAMMGLDWQLRCKLAEALIDKLVPRCAEVQCTKYAVRTDYMNRPVCAEHDDADPTEEEAAECALGHIQELEAWLQAGGGT